MARTKQTTRNQLGAKGVRLRPPGQPSVCSNKLRREALNTPVTKRQIQEKRDKDGHLIPDHKSEYMNTYAHDNLKFLGFESDSHVKENISTASYFVSESGTRYGNRTSRHSTGHRTRSREASCDPLRMHCNKSEHSSSALTY